MSRLAGFGVAGCMGLLALGCGVCALFSGGDLGPRSAREGGWDLMIKWVGVLMAAGLALAAVMVGWLTLTAKDTPRRRLTRAELLQARPERARRK